MTVVVTKEITKIYGETKAVDHVNLEAKDSEFVTLLGPSGCGKSTTLRIIAGLIKADEGRVYFNSKDMTDLPPNRRNIGFVFQRVALFPHMNVSKNIAFGLKARHFPQAKINKRIKEVLAIVHMSGYEKRSPAQMSGGQAQRIEIARVLATDPDVLLFDEPLSNIDAKLRDELKFEIRKIQRETRKTMIYVTHDQSEAFAISDKIYVINQGAVDQVGTPEQLYTDPSTPFVAGFIGQNNFVSGKVEKLDESSRIGTVLTASFSTETIIPEGISSDSSVTLCIRPEDIEVLQGPKFPSNAIGAKILESVFMGNTTRLHVDVKGTILKVDLRGPERFSYLNTKDKDIALSMTKSSIIKSEMQST
jgi:ABC-type Fe3+/spermidine/putrescine transport system ATPase subunit